jgi:glycosyltransferase involved in cell wall biosynthesis
MIGYSVIIPQRDRVDELRRQLPALCDFMSHLDQPAEVVVIDDGSAPATQRLLDKLLFQFPAVRLLRLDASCGTSVALSAGIAAARGEVLIATEAGDRYSIEEMPKLLGWLARADLVVGRRSQQGFAKFWHRVSRLPRWLLLGLESHDPDCLYWAARREVFAGISLTPGMHRYLPALAAHRGFRVCEMYVADRGGHRGADDVRPNPADLMAAWWLCRRWREANAYEVFANGAARGLLRLHPGHDWEEMHAAAQSGPQAAVKKAA